MSQKNVPFVPDSLCIRAAMSHAPSHRPEIAHGTKPNEAADAAHKINPWR